MHEESIRTEREENKEIKAKKHMRARLLHGKQSLDTGIK